MATIVPGHTDVDDGLYVMRIARLQSVAPQVNGVVTKGECRPIGTRRNADLGGMTILVPYKDANAGAHVRSPPADLAIVRR
jgi:hypothetical protein